jgi:hypothetical protein
LILPREPERLIYFCSVAIWILIFTENLPEGQVFASPDYHTIGVGEEERSAQMIGVVPFDWLRACGICSYQRRKGAICALIKPENVSSDPTGSRLHCLP